MAPKRYNEQRSAAEVSPPLCYLCDVLDDWVRQGRHWRPVAVATRPPRS